MEAWLVLIGLIGIFFVGPIVVFGFIAPRLERKRRFREIPHTTTVGQERTRIAMEDAIRNTQQNPPPAAPRSLSTRLAELDEALRAGQITQQDYAKARAAILASP